MPISNGYYLKARIICEKPIAHASPHIREVWDYLLREANYKDSRYGNFTVKRGQLFRSYSDIREALHWKIGWRKEMYSENQMKTTMRYLKKALMVTTRKALGGVLITVINYDTYQNPKNYENPSGDTSESTCCAPTRTPSSSDNNKNVKNKKNVKNDKNKDSASLKAFEIWWSSYPARKGRKIGKEKTSVLFRKIPKSELGNLNTATANYSRECNGLPKDPERFLRNDFWRDYVNKQARTRGDDFDSDYMKMLEEEAR